MSLTVLDDGGGTENSPLEKLFKGRVLESFLKLLHQRDKTNGLFFDTDLESIKIKNALVANLVLLGKTPIPPNESQDGKGPVIEYGQPIPYFDANGDPRRLAPGDQLKIGGVGSIPYSKEMVEQLRNFAMVETLIKRPVDADNFIVPKTKPDHKLEKYAGIKEIPIDSYSEEDYFNQLARSKLLQAYYFLGSGNKKRFQEEMEIVNKEKELDEKSRMMAYKFKVERNLNYDRDIMARKLFKKTLEELTDAEKKKVEERIIAQKKSSGTSRELIRQVRGLERLIRRRNDEAFREIKKFYTDWKMGAHKILESEPGHIPICSHVMDQAQMLANKKNGSEISQYLDQKYATVVRDDGKYCEVCGELTIPIFKEGINIGREGDTSDAQQFNAQIEQSPEQKMVYYDIRSLMTSYVDIFLPVDEKLIFSKAVSIVAPLVEEKVKSRKIPANQKRDTTMVYATIYNLAYLVRLFGKYSDLGSLKSFEPRSRTTGGKLDMRSLGNLMNRALKIIDFLHKKRFSTMEHLGVSDIKKALADGYKYMVGHDIGKMDKNTNHERLKTAITISTDPMYHLWRIVKTIETGKAPATDAHPDKILPKKLDDKVPEVVSDIINEYISMIERDPDKPVRERDPYKRRELTIKNVSSILPFKSLKMKTTQFVRKSNIVIGGRKNISAKTREIIGMANDMAKIEKPKPKAFPSWKFTNDKIAELERSFKIKSGPMINLGLSEGYIYSEIESRKVDPHASSENMLWRVSVLNSYYLLAVSYWMALNYYEIERQLPFSLVEIAKNYKKTKKYYIPDTEEYYQRLAYYQSKLSDTLTANYILNKFCEFLLNLPDKVGKQILEIILKIERARSKIDEIKRAAIGFEKERDENLDRTFDITQDVSDPFVYDESAPVDMSGDSEETSYAVDEEIENNTEGNL